MDDTCTGRHSRHSTTLTNSFFLFIDNITSEITSEFVQSCRRF